MSTIAFLNNNDGTATLALSETTRLVCKQSSALSSIKDFIDANSGKYVFSALSYDLKEEILEVTSKNDNSSQFPFALFWVPKLVVTIRDFQVTDTLQGELTPEFQEQIDAFLSSRERQVEWNVQLRARTSKQKYIKTVNELLNEIQFGNIYEINYCQEFYDDNCKINDIEAAYFKLNNITEAPFSAYISFDEFNILCGSPERFIKKEDSKIISQPIKGTSKRGSSLQEDELLKKSLLENPKERSENVMIVDLVRNDLSKIAQKSTVAVDELFGVYTFKTVHQLISTISCELKSNTTFSEILEATFPMGSMTGAPKKSAVEIIEKHENFRRGIYSGSIGYMAPNGDFDFNVVIRSLIYNSNKNYLSCAVGGAITIQSTPEAEYEECEVKVKTILDQMHA